jgi:hypothetical protein
MAPVLKTGVGETLPGVRIPPSPPFIPPLNPTPRTMFTEDQIHSSGRPLEFACFAVTPFKKKRQVQSIVGSKLALRSDERAIEARDGGSVNSPPFTPVSVVEK